MSTVVLDREATAIALAAAPDISRPVLSCVAITPTTIIAANGYMAAWMDLPTAPDWLPTEDVLVADHVLVPAAWVTRVRRRMRPWAQRSKRGIRDYLRLVHDHGTTVLQRLDAQTVVSPTVEQVGVYDGTFPVDAITKTTPAPDATPLAQVAVDVDLLGRLLTLFREAGAQDDTILLTIYGGASPTSVPPLCLSAVTTDGRGIRALLMPKVLGDVRERRIPTPRDDTWLPKKG